MTKKKQSMIKSKYDVCFDVVMIFISLLLLVVFIYPFLNILAISFNEATDTMYGLNGIFPRQFTLANYAEILADKQIFIATLNSVIRTVVGTVFSLIGCILSAYLIYHKAFIWHKFFAGLMMLVMCLSAGMIQTFILYKELNLIGTFAVYIIPNFIFPFNVMLIVSFMRGLPDSIVESANIDGANDFVILFVILVPLCLPVIASVALFCAVGQWSSWFDVMMYNGNLSVLSTLQYELQRKLASASINNGGQGGNGGDIDLVTPEAIRATMTIIATAPILVVYPFLQKYFVKGMTLGGVKE